MAVPITGDGSYQNGALKEKLAYDAWGKRRSLDGSSIADTIVGVTDNKGFTGHEMLEALELVHMNGRVYDPLVGRFMSGDPLVQDPTNGQNYNRYSYVLNNPTNLTDPTEFAVLSGEACTGTRLCGDNGKGAVGSSMTCEGDCRPTSYVMNNEDGSKTLVYKGAYKGTYNSNGNINSDAKAGAANKTDSSPEFKDVGDISSKSGKSLVTPIKSDQEYTVSGRQVIVKAGVDKGFADGIDALSKEKGLIIGNGWNDWKSPVVVSSQGDIPSSTVAVTPDNQSVWVNNSASALRRFAVGDFELVMGHEFKHVADWSYCASCMSNSNWAELRAHDWDIMHSQQFKNVKMPLKYWQDARKPYE